MIQEILFGGKLRKALLFAFLAAAGPAYCQESFDRVSDPSPAVQPQPPPFTASDRQVSLSTLPKNFFADQKMLLMMMLMLLNLLSHHSLHLLFLLLFHLYHCDNYYHVHVPPDDVYYDVESDCQWIKRVNYLMKKK